MKIITVPLSIHRGSSLMESLRVDGTATLAGYRVSGYIRRRMSDTAVMETIEGRIIPETRTIELFIAPSRTHDLPAGQFIYYVELVKGTSYLKGSNYINIQP